jgi:hypothetical protein
MVQGIEHLASHFVRVIKTELDIDLEYDPAAVNTLDAYIEQIRPNYTPESIPPGLVQSIGAFLGACIIATYGGRWAVDADDGDWGVARPEISGSIPSTRSTNTSPPAPSTRSGCFSRPSPSCSTPNATGWATAAARQKIRAKG